MFLGVFLTGLLPRHHNSKCYNCGMAIRGDDFFLTIKGKIMCVTCMVADTAAGKCHPKNVPTFSVKKQFGGVPCESKPNFGLAAAQQQQEAEA